MGRRAFVSGIEEINELLAVPPLTNVPGTQPWLMGVANVRGNLVPAIDLGRFLFDERTPSSERTRLLLVRQHGGTVGPAGGRGVWPAYDGRRPAGFG